jgi:putative transcriptional regulator
MTGRFGADLVESAKQALAYAEGRSADARVFAVPGTPFDVATLRRRLGLTQAGFAERFGLSLASVRDWEQGRRRPDRTATALLRVIDRAPEVVAEALRS